MPALSSRHPIGDYGAGLPARLAKLTANLRAVPNLRQQIREKVDCQTITLTQALNEFVAEAKQKLPKQRTQLAMIVDNLDPINGFRD